MIPFPYAEKKKAMKGYGTSLTGLHVSDTYNNIDQGI